MKKVKRPHIFMAPSFMAKFYEGYSDQDPDVTACYCLNYYGEIEVTPAVLSRAVGTEGAGGGGSGGGAQILADMLTLSLYIP